MKLSDGQHEFIEQVGRWWEFVSGSRSAGRILGWLMICEPPHRSAAGLVADLNMSVGSVSTQTRILEGIGFIEKHTFPGDRSTYHQLKPDVWVQIMSNEINQFEALLAISERGETVLPADRPDRVTDVRLIARFFVDRWPSFMDEMMEYLEKERQK